MEKLEDAGGSIPPLTSGTNAALPLYAFMQAADRAVTEARGEFEKERAKGCSAERAWIETQAGLAYPQNLTVCTDDTLYTYQTRWEWTGASTDGLHLRLGWDQALGPFYHDWPCGMFEGH